MIINEFYLYIFIIAVWLIYFINALYQSLKMKHFFPDKKIEVLSIPVHIFIIVLFFFIGNFFSESIFYHKEIYLSVSGLSEAVIFSAGFIFCIFSILLYIYSNFFEKSFPSCIAIKKGSRLTGIYKYVRHPSFYIFFLILFGTAFCLLNPLLFTLACASHICLYFYYMIEENQTKKTNPYYAEYLKKSNRFLPNFLKLKSENQ